MVSAQLALAAAAAAHESKAAEATVAVKELAMLTPQLGHEALQTAAAQATLESLQIYEQHAKGCVQLLVDALRAPEAKPDLAADAVWALHKMGSRCEEVHEWMLEAGVLHAVQNAMSTHATHNNLIQCSLGIVFKLRGCSGLISLLDVCVAGNDLCMHDSATSAIVWWVYALFKKDPHLCSAVELAAVLSGLLKLLHQRSHDQSIQEACCHTVEIIIRHDFRLVELLLESGGVRLLLDNLRLAKELGEHAETTACACANLLGYLASGSALHADVIRHCGGAQLLADCSCDGIGQQFAESAVWALGQLSGLEAVFEVMGRAPNSLALICGALDTIAELAGQVSAPCELLNFPIILRALLDLFEKMLGREPEMNCRMRCMAAICSISKAIAPYTEPGQVPELDHALHGLLAFLNDGLRINADSDIAELVAEHLGRIVLLKPSWKKCLQCSGADELFSKQIRSDVMHHRLLKYFFWSAAALYGLPFVCQELQSNLHCTSRVDAALCTIIDILDDDLEGDWILTSTEKCHVDAIPSVLMLINQAMRQSPADPILQSRGSHCISLLVPLLPPGKIPSETISVLFAAACCHSGAAHVMDCVFYAFRALLTSDACYDTNRPIAAVLRESGVEAIVRQAVVDHSNSSNAGLLEEATHVLCGIAGVPAVLQLLADAGPGPVRTIGIKAIVEFGRQQPVMLAQSAADIMPYVIAMSKENVEDDTLQQHVALLLGFCGHCEQSGQNLLGSAMG